MAAKAAMWEKLATEIMAKIEVCLWCQIKQQLKLIIEINNKQNYKAMKSIFAYTQYFSLDFQQTLAIHKNYYPLRHIDFNGLLQILV